MYINRKKISLVYASNNEIFFKNNYFLHVIIAIYLISFIILSIKPVNSFNWWLESIIPSIVIILLVALYTKIPLTNSSYLCVSIVLILHSIGSHYTYSLCTIGYWLQDILKCERNNYDKLVCFIFGMLIYFPILQLLYNRLKIRYFYACVIACFIMLSVSALNELVQGLISIFLNEQQSAIYLGYQGDVFDCQKDMAMVLSGSIITMLGCFLYRHNKNKKIHIVKTHRN